MTVIVDSRVRFDVRGVNPMAILAIQDAFTHKNPQHFKLVALGYKAWNEPATIKTCEQVGYEMSVPRGGYKRLVKLLEEHGHEVFAVDHRHLGDPKFDKLIPDYQGHKLRDYQMQAVASMLEKQNTIIRSATGSGKTSSLLAVAAVLKLPTLVIVWQGGLYEQWIRRITEELKIPSEQIGEIRGGCRRFGPVTVAMQQSLWKRLTPEIIAFPGVVIVDEVHRAAARTLREVVDAFPAKYRLGASDDERRTDQKEFLIYDAFGQPSQDINYNLLADQGHIVDVEVICIPTNYNAPLSYFDDPDFNVLLDDMTTNKERNELILKVTQSAVECGEQVFVMSHRVQHCVDIDRGLKEMQISSGLLLGTPERAAEFADTLQRMEYGLARVGVGTVQSIGTGIDLPEISVEVVMTPIASNETTFRQARGRICRTAKGKQVAVMYYMLDPFYGKKPVRNLMKWSRKVSVMVEGKVLPAAEWLRQG